MKEVEGGAIINLGDVEMKGLQKAEKKNRTRKEKLRTQSRSKLQGFCPRVIEIWIAAPQFVEPGSNLIWRV